MIILGVGVHALQCRGKSEEMREINKSNFLFVFCADKHERQVNHWALEVLSGDFSV